MRSTHGKFLKPSTRILLRPSNEAAVPSLAFLISAAVRMRGKICALSIDPCQCRAPAHWPILTIPVPAKAACPPQCATSTPLMKMICDFVALLYTNATCSHTPRSFSSGLPQSFPSRQCPSHCHTHHTTCNTSTRMHECTNARIPVTAQPQS
jgi:hypothetical protein